MRAAMKIVVALVLPLASYAQTELVTVVKSKVVSETTPAPDCDGLTGFEAGFCAVQRKHAQTPTPHTYYMLESEHSTYVLSCVPSGSLLRGRGRCPVLLPSQEYTLSIKGDQALIQAQGIKAMKFGLVEATSRQP